MSIYVFLGPSLPLMEAKKLLAANYLEPVEMGDVLRVVLADPSVKAILLIDGRFENTPSVWHKEILFAISRGIRVYGASSMGALRAAELHTFGMIGVGKIFEAYRDGELTGDDEVALIHAPAEFNYQALSEPMVNIRYGLEQAKSRSIIQDTTHRALLSKAKAIFYPGRSWPALLEYAGKIGIPQMEVSALKEYVQSEKPDWKREDAISALLRVAEDKKVGFPSPSLNFNFESTSIWEQLLASV